MQTETVSSATLTSADTDALLNLIESIRNQRNAEAAPVGKTSESATTPELPADTSAINTDYNALSQGMQNVNNARDMQDAPLPAVGRYVNIWA